MLSLSHQQLQIVMDAARGCRWKKRDLYLRRIAAMLTVRGRGHFDESDVSEIAKLVATGLIQSTGCVAERD